MRKVNSNQHLWRKIFEMYFLLINKISLIVTLLVQISVLFMLTGISKGDKNNHTEFSARECVSGLRKIKGECKECIGFFGVNCGQPCEQGFYGEGCRSSCNCSAGQTCNQFVGCFPSDSCSLDVCIEVKAERRTPSGGDCHCTHWPVVVSLIGFLAIVLGLVGYWVRCRMKRRRNHEIPGTKTVGHFRRRITCKKTTGHQKMGRGEEKPVDYDDHLLRKKNPNGEMEDVYNHIHFQKVPTVQSSSDEYGVIMKNPRAYNHDKSWPLP